MIIEQEWQGLLKQLNEFEKKDSRRTFYCGVLLAVTWFAEGKLSPARALALTSEIKRVISYQDEPQKEGGR